VLKRLAALVLLVGLCLPYGCDVRPITGVWGQVSTILFLGVPVLVALIYSLHTLVRPLAAFHEKHGALLHGIFRVVYFGLAGGYLAFAVTKRDGWPDTLDTAAALVVTGTLVTWQQGRGTKAARLPLLWLVCVGVAEVAYLVAFLRDHAIQYGGVVFTVGWVLAVVAEFRVLQAQPRIAHGG
jgi:hypothetical protein